MRSSSWARRPGSFERLSQEITEFASSFAELPALRRALENPVLEELQRETLLRQIARRAELSPLSVNALLVLLRRRRLGALPGIARRLRSLSDEKNGVCRAKIDFLRAACPKPTSAN